MMFQNRQLHHLLTKRDESNDVIALLFLLVHFSSAPMAHSSLCLAWLLSFWFCWSHSAAEELMAGAPRVPPGAPSAVHAPAPPSPHGSSGDSPLERQIALLTSSFADLEAQVTRLTCANANLSRSVELLEGDTSLLQASNAQLETELRAIETRAMAMSNRAQSAGWAAQLAVSNILTAEGLSVQEWQDAIDYYSAGPYLPQCAIDNQDTRCRIALNSSTSGDGSPQNRVFLLFVSLAWLPGITDRPFVTLNGTVPGPTLHFNQYDTVAITYVNELEIPIAIHHHGLLQIGTSFEDGVPGLTQCLVPAGSRMTYRFATSSRYGTYWMHSHHALTIQDGLFGAFVIHRLPESYEYQRDEVLAMSDYSPVLSTTYPVAIDDLPDTSAYPGSAATHIFLNGSLDGDLVWFMRSETDLMRLRLANTGSRLAFRFWIADVNSTVIELDGVDTHPLSASYVFLNVAQRASVLLTPSDFPEGFASLFFGDGSLGCPLQGTGQLCLPTRSGFVVWNATAFASRRGDSSSLSPPPLLADFASMNALDALPLDGARAPTWEQVTHLLKLNLQVVGASGPDVPGEDASVGINGFSLPMRQLEMQNPPVAWPYYQDAPDSIEYNFTTDPVTGKFLVSGSNGTYLVPFGAVVEMRITSQFNVNHAWHLHLYKMFVIGGETRVANNYIQRDVVSTGRLGETVVVRFVANNPGIAAMHCHLAPHGSLGMFGVLLIAPDMLANSGISVPAESAALCSLA